MQNKICNECNESKPVSEFYKETKMTDGYRKQCKECRNKKVVKRRHADPEAYNTYMRTRRLNPEIAEKERQRDKYRYTDESNSRKARVKANRERQSREGYNLMHYYGLTKQDREYMSKEQDHKCAICGKHADELKRGLMVDHDHSTGKVRGLLCDEHNKMLGQAQDDIGVLESAIAYLKKSKALKIA